MPLRRSVSTLIAAALSVTAMTAAVATAPSAGAHTTGSTAGKTYVALGDSYAAGFGLPTPATPTRTQYPGCAQTSLDYPHRLAALLKLRLTDASCSGATTADFYAPQNVPGPPAQLDVVKALQPDLVTVTIGGNDLGFTSIATTCLAATQAGPLFLHPTFASCAAYFASRAGSADNPFTRLEAVGAKVRTALMAVHKAAPHARVVVIAYPAIAPNARNTPLGGCFAANPIPTIVVNGARLTSAFPFTNVDVPFLARVQQRLDAEIAEATRDSGGSYADIYDASLPHSACSPESTRWVEPVVPGGLGFNVLHPSLAGTTAMAITLAPTSTWLLTHDRHN